MRSRPRRDSCVVPWYVAPGSTSIAAEYVGVALRNASRRLAAPSLLPHESESSLHYWIGFCAVLILIGACVWWQPDRHLPAALGLGAALGLDLVARLFVVMAARRSGLASSVRGLPSLVLLIGSPAGLAATGLAGILAFGADCFPVLASFLAGIVAMTAIARLAVAYSLFTAKNEADDD